MTTWKSTSVRGWTPLGLASCLCALLGCSSSSSATGMTTWDGGADGGSDSAAPAGEGGPDASDGGAGTDTGATAEGGGTAGDAGGADANQPVSEETYKDFSAASNWSTFDTSTLGGGVSSFITAGFDGRYLYYVPLGNGVVARFDTRATFGAASSWTTFDVGTVETSAGGFRGAAFDGRYLYLVPYLSAPSTLGGVAVRYDTHGGFASAASWTTFDITTVNAGAIGFIGATFDGRYLYLVPYGEDGMNSGIAAQYDTWGSFTAAASWTTFDTTTLGAAVLGFYGATFDGRYVYYSPYGPGTTIARFDTLGSFADATSWATFATTTIGPHVVSFFGTTSDDRYNYYLPYTGNNFSGGMVARYDRLGDFSSAASWSAFDSAALGVAPAGGVFDGRFIYLVPNGYSGQSTWSGVVGRYDTQSSFTATSSWTTFDTTTISPGASGFFGGAFDGEYVYLVPNGNPIAVRFDAKTPPSMPTTTHGSFY